MAVEISLFHMHLPHLMPLTDGQARPGDRGNTSLAPTAAHTYSIACTACPCCPSQTGKRDLVIEATDSRQSVYVYACKDCVVKIKGKVR